MKIDREQLIEKIGQLTATEISENPYYKLYRNGVITYEEFLRETVEMIEEKEKKA